MVITLTSLIYNVFSVTPRSHYFDIFASLLVPGYIVSVNLGYAEF